MADEVTVELEKLPGIVRSKAKQLLPEAKWHGAVKVQEGDKTAYELDGTNGEKNDVTVTITAEGKIVECDENLIDPETKTPPRVLKAVRKKWPKFEVTESHLIRLGEDLKGSADGNHVYDLHGIRGQEKNVHVQVSADGELLEWTNELPLGKVPERVKSALERDRRRFKPDTVFAISEKDNVIIGYRYEGKSPKGLEKSFFVSADGKHVEQVDEQN